MKKQILGMSMKRKELSAWIDNHTFQVMVALAQLYLFPHGNRVHWRREVWEKFSRIYKLKATGKVPDAEFIFESSWGCNQHNIPNALRFAEDKECDYIPQEHIVYDEFYQITQDYFLWLADKLSRNEVVFLSEVLDQLDRLGLRESED